MAIINVNLVTLVSDRGASGPTNTETYLVETDGEGDARSVRDSGHPDLPVRGSLADDGSVCSSVSVSMISGANKNAFTYTAKYEQIDPDKNPEDDDPLTRPPEIRWEGLEITEVAEVDLSDPPQPIRNSAGDKYATQPERPVLGGAVTITRNEAKNPGNTCILFSNSANSAVWHGVALWCAKLGIVSSDKQYENGVHFWRTTYPIQFNRNGWKLKLYDNGYRKKVGEALMNCVDGVGNTPSVPVFLDGEGGELPAGEDPVIFPEEGYKLLTEQDWTSLKPPNPFK